MRTPIPLKKPGRKSKRPIRYEFELNYYTLGRSASDLSKKYNVKENTIYQWAMQFRKEERKGVGYKQKKDLAS